ncbi:MAG: saccharopine dehydrogenase C-terminal domain-containing protein [candidate division WOR-3 bacterium]
MKVLILGCGMQGRIVADDLSRFFKVAVLDVDRSNLVRLNNPLVKKIHFDIRDQKKVIRLISDYDLVIGALPARFGFYSMECAIESGVDMVDMSYSPADPFLLNREAKKAKIRIVPDAGYAPGLSNILVGEAYTRIRKIDSLKIMVGGIPQRPIPPFSYRITWSPSDLIEEYTRPARIFRNYRVITVPALTGIEQFYVPQIGTLEAFYTDGLRTLLRTMCRIKNMEEKTIRYAGHATIFKTLIDCGFFSDKPIMVDNHRIPCAEFTFRYLKQQLSQGPEHDLTILIIELKGAGMKKKYQIVDHYDRKNKITSMARMTGYSCAVIARCIKDYPESGIIPPEYLGMKPKICEFIKCELRKRRIMGL